MLLKPINLFSGLLLLQILSFSCEGDRVSLIEEDNSSINFGAENLQEWRDYIAGIPQGAADEMQKCPANLPPSLTDRELEYFHLVEFLYINDAWISLEPDTLQVINELIDKYSGSDNKFFRAKLLLFKANHVANEDDMEQARNLLDEGIEILFQKVKMERCDSFLLADMYNLSGICSQWMMYKDYSISSLQSGIAINKKLGRYREVAKDLSNISINYYHVGEADQSLCYTYLSKLVWKKLLETRQDTFDFLANKANHSLGLSLKAEQYLDKDCDYQFRVYLDSAIVGFRQIRDVLNSFPKTANNAPYHFRTNYNIAADFRWADYYPALADSILYYTQEAESSISQVPRHYSGVLNAFKGYAYSKKGDCALAEKYFQNAMDSIILKKVPRVVLSDFFYLKVLELTANGFYNCYNNNPDDEYFLVKSYRTYIDLVNLFIEMRGKFATQASQEGLIQKNSHHFSKAVEIAWLISEGKRKNGNISGAKNYLEKSFFMAERSKAFTFQQGIYENLSKMKFSGKKKELLEREISFKRKLQSSPPSSPQHLTEIQNYRAFTTQLSRSSDIDSFSYFLERFDTSIPTVKDLQNKIVDDKTALIEYQLGVKFGMAFVITQSSFFAVPLSVDSLLFHHLTEYKKSLTGEAEYYQNSAIFLYQRLFEPLATRFPNEIKKLIIIPDKEISEIPFGALLSPLKTKNDSYSTLPYLINEYAITYYYSLNSLFQIKALDALRENTRGGQEIWGAFIANPDSDVNKDDYLCSTSSIDNIEAATMAVYDELITPRYPHNQKPFRNATAIDFLNNAPRFKLLQLSLHTCMSDQSYLQFLSSSIRSNKITTTDIYNLSLNADNVVLANCSSAVGQNVKGEGLNSFARAFALSGCSSIIANMASVSDAPTSEVIKNYYEYLLKKNQEKHQALQNAKIRYMKKHPNEHPWKWANIICIGNPEKLSFINQ